MNGAGLWLKTAAAIVAACCIVAAGDAVAQDWELVDSASFEVLVPASEKCCLEAHCAMNTLTLNLPADDLTSAAEAAVEIAPTWLKRDLRDSFRRLGQADQDLYAGLINAATDPYVDEICFEVAHIAPQTLGSAMDPQVLVENVELLYEIDTYLDYANIVDYYDGDDYYSTIVYSVLEGEEVLEIELPREQYYWYVVHPKLHKETPDYINPLTGLPADPPTGVFWRDYLMNHNDTGYPLLRSALAGCSVLWKGRQNDLDNGAVGTVTQWIQDIMTFQSYPHHDQPVRIYHWHIGTCSVHSYLTAAAARAALIPAAVNVMYSDNHKINEFWERRWIAWEPVNTFIDYPEGYENWGWNVAAAFNWRGDSFIWDEVFHYTEVCTLDVSVTDEAGRPVDGARIKIHSVPCVSWGATAGWTDCDGRKQFLLGDNRSYTAAVNSSIGNYPPSGMVTVVSGSVPGAHYNWDVTLPGSVPELDMSADSPPGNPTEFHRLVVEYDLPAETLYGNNFDDGNSFSEPCSPGHIDFFICDAEEYEKYLLGDSFQAFEINCGSSAGTVDFILPRYETWYALLSNEANLVLTQDLQVTVSFYATSTGVESAGEVAAAGARINLQANYPNPFNPETRIPFEISTAGHLELAVYDVSGRRVRTLISEYLPAGKHSATWNGEDDEGQALSSGIYLYRLQAGEDSQVRRMLLVK